MRPLVLVLTTVMLLLISSISTAQQSLTIGSTDILGLSEITVSVTLDATADVQGFVLAIGYDDSLVTATGLTPAGEASAAELQVPEILTGGATLGVVMDANPPYSGSTISSGTGIEIAILSITPKVVVTSDTTTMLTFADGTLNSPALSNMIVQGGLSVGASEGLGLINGTLTLVEPPPASMTMEDGSAAADGLGTTGDCRVLLDNSIGGVQGFVTAVTHDPAIVTLESISTGSETDAANAEFEMPNLYPDGGTLGVVIDFTSPFDGQTIPMGTGLHIATYTYSCNNSNIFVLGDPGGEPAAETSAIDLADDTLGEPRLDNVVVVAGLSVSPLLAGGTFTCEPVGVPAEDTTLWMETEFDEGSGNYAYHGQTGDLCFFYADEDDYIQGFTFTVCYDCHLTIHEDSWEFNGSILDQVGVEYTAVQVDDDPDDGDGCELIVALLLDALPPFEGQTLPQTISTSGNSADGRLLVGKMRVTVDMDAECNEDQLIEWCNDINGNGNVTLYNNVVINFQSIQTFERNDSLVHVVPEEIFQRGDCNSDDTVDLADTATMLGNQFNGHPILCPDACDSNDDGHLNMADAVHLLNWLFKFGDIPPAPGPLEDGPDATQDDTLPVCDSDDTNC
ncbi:MAG TPA: hypothetical protein EYN40_00745 [Planctomycetes bacterium]|nr:hypothetical protein [Planctomycetota bacterium]